MKNKKIKGSDVLGDVLVSASVISLMPPGKVGHMENVGILADRKGELPPIVVLTEGSACGLTTSEEDAVVNAAIQNLPEFQAVKAEELPFPADGASKEYNLQWIKSDRLRFVPLVSSHFYEQFCQFSVDNDPHTKEEL